jgi:hypothetical protein
VNAIGEVVWCLYNVSETLLHNLVHQLIQPIYRVLVISSTFPGRVQYGFDLRF